MTALEMKEEFLVGYDKVASLTAPGYNNDEISQFLSEAQERYVKTHYHPLGNKYREGYEQTEKRRKDLGNVLRSVETTLSADQTLAISDNSFIYDLPEDYWLIINEWVETDDTCKPRKKVIPVTHDEYWAIERHPFKKPNNKKVWRLDTFPDSNTTGPSRHELVTDGNYNIEKYIIRYIKTLSDIDITNQIDCELHPMTHREIVALAVTIALENQQEPRFQTNIALGQQAE